MAQAQLNELLELAASRCEELSADAEEAQAAVEALVEQAQGVADRIAGEGAQVHQHLQDLTARLEAADEGLGTAGDTAESALEGLVQKAAEVQAEVGQVLDQVKQGLAELAARKQALGDHLQARVEGASTDVDQLTRQVDELQAAVGQRLQQASTAIQELNQRVGAAREEWHTRRTDLQEALDDLVERATAQTNAYSSEIADILDGERIEVLVRRLTNEMLIGHHNEAVDVLGDKVETEAPARLDASRQPLLQALAELKQLCAEHEAALGARAAEVEALVGGAAESIDRMSPGLDAASRLG